MAEEKEAGLPGRSRLPGFDEDSGRGYRGDYGDRGYSASDRGPYGYGPPRGYDHQYPPPAYARDSGIRASRRTSTWTAAALIAAVAATTGYLAHSIPSTTTSGTTVGHTTSKQSGQTGGVQSGTPGVSGPVVTSGGSGAAGRAGGGDN